jgi:hypothetical protein
MKQNHQSGQSTIEFIFTFAFGVSFILLIFNSALNYATGYIVHYATFMASRAYLVSDSYIGNYGSESVIDRYQSNGTERAQATFQRYNLSVFKVNTSGFKLNHSQSALPPNQYLTTGAYTSFEMPMDVLGKVLGQDKLQLTSESFLGKDPTKFSCAVQVCKAITGQASCQRDMDVTLFDDGC